jgi:hypothetical protein
MYADENGKFLLRGIPAGNYIIAFDAKEGYNDYQKTNVSVTVGSVTDMGTVTLE